MDEQTRKKLEKLVGERIIINTTRTPYMPKHYVDIVILEVSPKGLIHFKRQNDGETVWTEDLDVVDVLPNKDGAQIPANRLRNAG